jgi:MSHA biogenesis protein MshQ
MSGTIYVSKNIPELGNKNGPGYLQKISALVGLLLLVISTQFIAASAQAATYAYRNDVFAYDTPSAAATSVSWHTTGASPACTSYPLGDDDWADVAFPSGFTFIFGGVTYSKVRVYSNGMLVFGTDTSGYHRNYNNLTLPITASALAYAGCSNGVPVNVMAPYWNDIVAGTGNATTGASVQYELLTDPVTGLQRFVISWVNVKLYGQAIRYNFQVALYASTAGLNGNFKYQYTTGSSTGSDATVGVQLTTADYTLYSFNQAFIDPAVGTTILWYPANQLAAKGAGYNFDESAWTGAAGEIIDNSGSNRNATRVGVAANIAAGRVCRGGSFTSNTSNATIDAVATPIVPADIGSVDFWYYSTNKWNSADTMLFDATTVAARPFFLMKRNTGALRFAITDSAGVVRTAETSTAYTYAAKTWHHVGVSWNLQPGTNQTVQRIFLDGVLVNTLTSTPYHSTTSGNIATLGTLYIGDNRTSGVTPSTGTPNGANGTIDEVNIYPIDINASQAAADMALTHSCAAVDHFHIVHGGELVNCNGAVANITIEAHDVNHNLVSLAGTTMQMSTSTGHGTWSNVAGGSINPVNNTGGGTGNYTFSNESSIVIGLSDTFIESLNINLSAGTVTEHSGAASSCVSQDYTYLTTCDTNLNFADSGFLYNVPDHVSETSQSVTVSAVKKSTNSLSCVPAFASVSKAVTFTCAYTNPASGTLPVRVGGKALNAANNAIAACDATGQAVNLTFDNTGVATTTVQYADVGKMTLNAQYSASGLNMVGTDTFIAAPASFAFSGISAGPIKAGTNFNATITARNNASAATPNFGKESTAESVTLSHSLLSPAGGTDPSLGNSVIAGTEFGAGGMVNDPNGVASVNNLNWGEVGNITLTANLTSASYLGSGLSATSASTTVGRFIPDHFDTAVSQVSGVPMPCPNNPTVLTCPPLFNGFIYSGQPFTVNVYARNASGGPSGTTQNYDGTLGFSKNVTLSAWNALGSSTAAVGGTLGNYTIPAASFKSGTTATTGGTPATPVYTFNTAPTAPTDIYLRATDADSVTSLRSSPSSSTEGGVKVVNGRTRISNAYGSELLPLTVAVTAQYWNATSGWVTSSTDSVSSFLTANLIYSNCKKLMASSSWPTTCPPPTSPSPVSVVFNAGTGNFILSAPGAGKTGSVDMNINLPGYLPSTTARATFGVYKGSKEFIFQRENY